MAVVFPAWATLLHEDSYGGGKAAATYNLSYNNLEITFPPGVEVIIVVVRNL